MSEGGVSMDSTLTRCDDAHITTLYVHTQFWKAYIIIGLQKPSQRSKEKQGTI